jgi:hypothetical protein
MKKRFYLGISIVAFLMSSLQVLGQENQVMQGVALDQAVVEAKIKIRTLRKGNGSPVKRAEFSVGEAKYFTDPEGNAEFVIPPTVKEIKIFRVGFEPETLTEEDFKNVLVLDVFLRPALAGDNEVIVIGKRKPSVSKKVISVQEARKVAPSGDPGQVIKLMPGVQSSVFRSTVAVRGSAPDDSKYMIDDLEVPFVYHGFGQLSVIPPDLFEDVEFLAGGFGPEYGNATGGVISLRTKTEVPERPMTKFTLNLPFYTSVYHERPISDHEGLYVGVRRSYIDKILPAVIPKDSGITLLPYFSDYQAIYVNKREDGHYKLTALASVDGIKASLPSEAASDDNGSASFDLKTYYGIVGLERNYRINNEWTMVTTPQHLYSNNHFYFNDLAFKLKYWSFRAPTEFTKRISTDEKLYLGFDPTVTKARVFYYAPRFDARDPLFDIEEAPKEEGYLDVVLQSYALWLARDVRLGDFILTPGLRPFYYSGTKKFSADPRFSWRYLLSKEQTIKGAVGQYSMYPRNGEDDGDYGNPKLQFPRSYHYVLGLESKWDQWWSTDIQLFHKHTYDLVVTDDKEKYINDGELVSTGGEFFLRRAMTERWFGWLSYTYSVNRERDHPSEEWRQSEYDQTHVVNLAGNYRWTAVWESGGRLAYHTGDTYNSKLGEAVYNANLDKYQPRGIPERNSKRLPDYHELSLYSGRDILWDTWQGNMRFGVEYLWSQRQVLGASPNYDYSKEELSRALPPIPYIELSGQF